MAKDPNEAVKALTQGFKASQKQTEPTAKRPSSSDASKDPQSQVPAGIQQAMARFWTRMAESYGYPWTRQFGEIDGSAYWTWCRAVADLTPADIKRGFTRALERESRFPPNMSEFRGLCLPGCADLGMPETLLAYREAAGQSMRPDTASWSHPAVYLAGSATGWFNLRTLPESQTWPQFRHFYAQLFDRVRQGEDLHEDMPKPIAPPSKVSNKTSREESLQRVRGLISLVDAGDDTSITDKASTDDERGENE